MKKFIFLFLIVVVPYQLIADSVIDERVTDIYFGNGILTTKAEADYAKDKILAISILSDIYHGDKAAMQAKHGEKIQLAYNSTFKGKETAIGKLDEVSGGILDIMESYEQLKNTSLGWKLFSNVKDIIVEITLKKGPLTGAVRKKIYDYLISKFVPDYLATYVSVQLTDKDLERIKKLTKYAADQLIKDTHDRDLGLMVGAYEKSIKQGHGVIMLAHSQGNLFAIEAVDKVTASNPWMKNYFYHVSIASPATKAAVPAYRLISLDNDPVAYLSPLPRKYSNPLRSFKHKATSITPAVLGPDWYDFPPIDPHSPEGIWVKGDQPKDYDIDQYVDERQHYLLSPTIGQVYHFEVTADEKFAELAFHAFDYYMGAKSLSAYYNTPNGVATLAVSSTKTRDGIILAIKEGIKHQKDADSQWQKAKEIGCPGSCDHRIEVTHRYDPALFILKMEDYPLTIIKQKTMSDPSHWDERIGCLPPAPKALLL